MSETETWTRQEQQEEKEKKKRTEKGPAGEPGRCAKKSSRVLKRSYRKRELLERSMPLKEWARVKAVSAHDGLNSKAMESAATLASAANEWLCHKRDRHLKG